MSLRKIANDIRGTVSEIVSEGGQILSGLGTAFGVLDQDRALRIETLTARESPQVVTTATPFAGGGLLLIGLAILFLLGARK